MAAQPESNRRDFLTGKAGQRALRHRADEVVDAILGEEEIRVSPKGADTIRLETRAMACQWAVVMNPGAPRQVMVASDALDFVHEAEDFMTVYRDSSETSQLNRSAAKSAQPVSEALFKLLKMCEELWKSTEGAFDPATGSLIQLWRSARQSGRIPEQSEIDSALALSGFQHVVIDDVAQTVRFDTDGVLLDFGAIGKGYAVDLAARHLLSEDVVDYIVHGGHSSLYARGNHGGHDGWPIGIKNPLLIEKSYATVLLRDQGMATSGSNVQFFRHNGRRFGHILSPFHGWPEQELLSVTVLAPNAGMADALSTAFYVMGLDTALRYCDDHPEVGAILVPPPADGRTLQPIIRNLPQNQLFFEHTPPERTT
ncbi:FAD:protein FMN transferase [Planctomicrobium sp. SH668]|uniref:FAD:protein FMN transferase n=1 Tax=Planctomicrobium sp. SH668 TaxID=3448126 RepID=UPI003F5C5E88